jgi:hypothetical protein
MGGEKGRGANEDPKLEIPPALAAAAALIVAVLAAVGVSGDALTRAVRNDPIPLATVIILVLLVVGTTTAILNRAKRILALAVTLLTALLATTVFLGALALGEREQPSVSLSSQVDESRIAVTIHASGSSLKSKEDMLVQLQALEHFPEDSEGRSQCERSRFEEFRPGEEPLWPGPLLLWQQTGPDADGTVAVESTVEVPVGQYEGVCAFVALRSDGKEPRYVRSYLRFPTAGLGKNR